MLNEYLQPVPVGVAGNLYVSGVALARGYYKQAGQSADRFVPDPFATEPGARMYHTGDVVRWNQTGEMEFIGRTDDQVKIRGYRVELGGVANVLLDIPEVDNAFVCSQKLDNGSDQLVAYIVASLADETQTAKVDHLKPRLEQRLPNYMVPQIYIFVDDIPLNSNGKVDRKALPVVSGEHLYRAEYVAPRNETERVLCQMWSALLDVERIGIHDDFYALGGHSLVATRLLSAIRHEFNVEFPMKVLLETPTIAQLSEQLLSGEFAVAAMGIGDDDITPDSDIEEIEF